MKQLLFSTLVLISAHTGFAQVQSTVLELQDAKVHINSNGILFHDYPNRMAGYEVPLNSENHALFAATLWISGLDNQNNLRTAATTFCQQSPDGFCDLFSGPLTTDGTASTNDAVFEEYNRFWFITREQVETHTDYFTCLYNPTCNTEIQFPEGYTTPQEILEWPAHGNISMGLPFYLAPFVDVNGNGSYQPHYGDYPSFPGDEAVYMILNDKGGEHLNSGGAPFGIELHTMVYYYLDSHPALSRTVYVHQDIINRSTNDFHDMYIGIWNDFDLGDPRNDYIGTDVENSYVYVYNGNAYDDASPEGPGYGADNPMMACKIIAGPYKDPNGIDDVGPFSGAEYGNYTKGWNDGIIDNERIGLSGSLYHHNSPAVNGDPQTPQQYHNYLRSIWKDFTPMTFGGTGYNPDDPDLLSAKYHFPGMSDPQFMGTDGVDPEYPIDGGWTEENSGLAVGDRRVLASSGPFSLNAGQKQSIDYVYVFAQQSDDPDSDLHDLLTEYVNYAAGHVDSLPAGVITSVKNIQPEQVGFGLYPNPAANEITIAISGNMNATTYRIFNVLGSQVKSGALKGEQTTVDISGLNRGLYLVNVQVRNRMATKKLVIE